MCVCTFLLSGTYKSSNGLSLIDTHTHLCMRLLLFLLAITYGQAPQGLYSLIAVHERVTNPEELRAALKRAYEHHIVGSSKGAGHMVSLWVGANPVLTWTDATSEEGARAIHYAIDHVELQALSPQALAGCTERYSFAAVLETIRTSEENAGGKLTNVYMVVDEAQDSATYEESARASEQLTHPGSNVQIYPLGIGKCVQTQELRRISGPCHPLFGCHAPFAYYQSRTYAGLQRAQSEVRAKRAAHKKHAITTEEGLTPAQLAITIVLCVVVGVLILWCLMYSLCYGPKLEASVYTDPTPMTSRVRNAPKRTPFAQLFRPRERLF